MVDVLFFFLVYLEHNLHPDINFEINSIQVNGESVNLNHAAAGETVKIIPEVVPAFQNLTSGDNITLFYYDEFYELPRKVNWMFVASHEWRLSMCYWVGFFD